ncbi:hypothetical protein CFOL_v3_26962, partial [Cephalotus follicularis]
MGGPDPGPGPASSGSSGGEEEEDGNAEWRAAIDSIVATTSATFVGTNGFTNYPFSTTPTIKPITYSTPYATEEGQHQHNDPQKLKHYQIKAQKLLDDIVEKTLVTVKDPIQVPDNDPMNEGGIRLFKNSPLGIVFDHIDEIQGPRKRPRILPGKEIDENSKKFKRQLQSVAVEGVDIMAAARDAHHKLLARLEAKDAAAKEKAKREEERIAELKKIRGEKWLPSIAKEMQMNINPRQLVETEKFRRVGKKCSEYTLKG